MHRPYRHTQVLRCRREAARPAAVRIIHGVAAGPCQQEGHGSADAVAADDVPAHLEQRGTQLRVSRARDVVNLRQLRLIMALGSTKPIQSRGWPNPSGPISARQRWPRSSELRIGGISCGCRRVGTPVMSQRCRDSPRPRITGAVLSPESVDIQLACSAGCPLARHSLLRETTLTGGSD